MFGCRAPSRKRAEAIYIHVHRVRCICHNIDLVRNSASASPQHRTGRLVFNAHIDALLLLY